MFHVKHDKRDHTKMYYSDPKGCHTKRDHFVTDELGIVRCVLNSYQGMAVWEEQR